MKVELAGKPSDTALGLGLVVGGRQTEIVSTSCSQRNGRQSRSLEKNGRYSGLKEVDGVPAPYGPMPITASSSSRRERASCGDGPPHFGPHDMRRRAW